ncbi:MAG TPA: carboxypeptidase regulatory-like domain-containing protein [Gemmatimonadaceae bacterium]|nr:carboxypeptidase regulatory-like domain-containing protein [Gemmatimonadaceae bacterium]
MRASCSVGLAAAALVAFPAAGAQAVRGAIVDETTRRPVAGAVVGLVDADGREVVTTLSSESGRFTLRAPAPGAYALRTRRIGLRAVSSAPLQLGVGEWTDYTFAVRAEPVPLAAVLVTARGKQCDVRPAEGAAAAVLFDEARTALTATAVSQRERRVAVTRRRYVRELDARTGRVLREHARDETITTDRPFSSLPPEELAARGYRRQVGDSVDYYGPDADVLLSESFAEGHCFRVITRRDGDSELAGLAFEPVRRRATGYVDIEGTLWLDAKSAELRFVEYRYTGLPRGVPRDKTGGRLDFRRLPTGVWIVERWALRTASLGLTQRPAVLGRAPEEEREYTLLGLRETGGVVGGPVLDARPVVVTGTVFDSTRGRPLVGAQVFLSGTSHVARSDSSGRFVLEGPLPGTYALSFLHPRLDSLGWVAPGMDVTLSRGEPREVVLAVPVSAAPAVVATAGPASDSPARRPAAQQAGAWRDRTGFDTRRREGHGHFIDEGTIVKRGPARLSDLLRSVPGVRIIPAADDPDRVRIAMGRSAAGTRLTRTEPDAPARSSPGGSVRTRQRPEATPPDPGCPVELWLDRVRVESADGDIDRLANPADVVGIEVYTGAAAPPEFRTGNVSCGAILIWTRH